MMSYFARIDGGKVAEIILLPEDLDPGDAFHADLAAALVPIADDTIQVGMTWNGRKFGPASAPPLPPAPRTVSRVQFAQEAAARGLSNEDQALAWAASGSALPDKLKALVDALPQAEQFPAKMALCKDTFDRLDLTTIKLTTEFGWDDAARADYWSAASAH